jgi:hypothetical protein
MFAPDPMAGASSRSPTSVWSGLGFTVYSLAWAFDENDNPGITSTVSTPEDCMTSKAPEALDAEPKTEEIKDLLGQAQALAKRVEAMPEGARKERLRATLSELQVIADQLMPAVPDGG